MRLIHITPGLPPASEALGEYAVLLGHRLHDVSGGYIESWHVAAGHRALGGVEERRGFRDVSGDRDPQALAQAVLNQLDSGPGAVLLHYVGYGYAPRGAPLWLLRGLHRVVRTRPDTRVVTMFHELYARGGRPWQSSFWIAPVQRYVARALARTSAAVFTNRRRAAEWLRTVRGPRPADSVRFSPTFSNVGEPLSVPAWEDRRPVATIFGGSHTRGRSFASAGSELSRALDAVEVETVWEIGPPRPRATRQLHGRPVERLGMLPSQEVSERLLLSRLGVLHYPLDALTKSGVASAYLSHGVPIALLGAGPPVPELKAGVVYLTPGSVTAEAAARCSARGFDWYRDHARSELAAERILPLLTGRSAMLGQNPEAEVR